MRSHAGVIVSLLRDKARKKHYAKIERIKQLIKGSGR